MKFPRRQFLHLAVGTVAPLAVSRFAWADTYPSRPVRFIVGFPAGNASDILARLTGQWLSERLAQNFVIETVRALAAVSPPKLSSSRRRMDTRCSWSSRRTQ
jgi:hypothetical protein